MNKHVQLLKIICVCLLLNLLSGCWDIKEIQDMNYISAIGIDYEDDHFVLYTQMLDFTSIAKSEGGQSSPTSDIWTGKTEGKTLDIAMNDLYNSSQERSSWGHISSIILSENVLKSNLLPQLDTITRYQEIRVTPWVYGTDESIEDLLNVPAFYNLSPLNTLLHEPTQVHEQKSYISPIRYFDFVAAITEPGYQVLLPRLTIDLTTWRKNNKEDPKLNLNGVFAMSDHKLNGLLTNDKLTGLRWLDTGTHRSPLAIKKDNDIGADLILQKPKIKKKLYVSNGVPKYKIHVKLKGSVVELRRDFSINELEKEAAKAVKEEILSTYKHGYDINADLYRLSHLLFKQQTDLWKKLNQTKPFILGEDSLELVTVDVTLDSTGMKILSQ